MKLRRTITFIIALIFLMYFSSSAHAVTLGKPHASNEERYIESHYIASNMSVIDTLINTNIASELYSELDGIKSDFSDVWNFVSGQNDNYLQLAVVELLLGEFSSSGSADIIAVETTNSVFQFLNAINSIVETKDFYNSIAPILTELQKRENLGEKVTRAELEALCEKVLLVDPLFFIEYEGVLKKASVISDCFGAVTVGITKYNELLNLYYASAVLNTMSEEYAQNIIRLKALAQETGNDALFEAIHVVESYIHFDEWDVTMIKNLSQWSMSTVVELFFDNILTDLAPKFVFRVTKQILASAYLKTALAAYEIGSFVCDFTLGTNDLSRAYAQMEALATIEKTNVENLVNAKYTFLSSPTLDNAKIFHGAIRLQQQIQIDACEIFIEICKVFNNHQFYHLWNDTDYASYISMYESLITTIRQVNCCTYADRYDTQMAKQNLNYVISKEKVTITGYNNTFEAIRIPNEIDGYPVTHIEECAFEALHTLTDIELPDTLLSIGKRAFDACSNLTKITIPENVTELGDYSFANCNSLTKVLLPHSIQSIGNFSFANCLSLTSINLPNGLTSIGSGAFSSCRSINHLTIPDSVTTIQDETFENCSNLLTITLPDTITNIGDYAFHNCSNLDISLPASLRYIGQHSFEYCSALTRLSFPEGLITIGPYAFANCCSIPNLSLPQSLQHIGEYSFSSCTNIKSVSFSPWSNVSLIREGAFAGCSSLFNITFPDTLTTIAPHAFRECVSLRRVILPDSLIAIEEAAFYHCLGLTHLIIPANIDSIGHFAFEKCTNLSSLTIENAIPNAGDYIFASCTSLSSVSLPDNLSSISEGMFANCYSLTEISLPSMLSTIESMAFYNCSINHLFLPESISIIGSSVFPNTLEYVVTPHNSFSYQYFSAFYPNIYVISKLPAALTLPSSLFAIGTEAFAQSSVTTVSLPDGIEKIEERAFADCTVLEQITIPASVISIAPNAFNNHSARLVIFTEPNSVAAQYANENDIICITDPNYQ